MKIIKRLLKIFSRSRMQRYARKFQADRLERNVGKLWYIPTMACIAHKSRRKSVVFDCSGRFKGTSLNNHLLKAPDQTNQLVGVLLRFRKEPIAFMAYIENMFYQVRIPDSDADLLRFLWWTDGDLTKEPEEYQMLVHFFGAVSSPSCSNYALLKTADDSNEKVMEEVIDKVKKNFYVDDCLKSTPTISHAVDLAHDLPNLLMKGDFHLTQWTSNSCKLLSTIPEEKLSKTWISTKTNYQ